MRRDPFCPELLRLAQAEPSALQIAALKAMELWALISAAEVEAASRGDDRLSFRLGLIGSVLSLPDEPA